METEGFRAGLEAQKLPDKSVVPDLTLNGIEEFMGRDKIPLWMRESSAAQAVPYRPEVAHTAPGYRGRGAGPAAAGGRPGVPHLGTMIRSQGAYQILVPRPGDECHST